MSSLLASPRSERLLIVPLFPVLLAGAFPVFLMSFLGFAGLGVLGALMMSAALTVGLDADAEFRAQRAQAGRSGRLDGSLQATQRDAMVRFAKIAGAAGALLVTVAIAGLVITA